MIDGKDSTPSAPIESPAVTANQTQELPQPAPKKQAAKKTAAKKAPAEKTPAQKAAATRAKAVKNPAKRDPNARASDDNRLSAAEVASQILDGSRKWMSGRERDILLAQQGYDLDEIRREITIERGKRMVPG